MKYVAFGLVVAWITVASAATRGAAPATLYERLGGQSGVAAIAVSLIERVATDPHLGRSFEGTNRTRIEQHLTQQICQLAGGPCHYEGDPMRTVHAGQKITEGEFYGMVEVLEDVLKSRQIALADRNQLLRQLAPMKRDVVQIPPADG